MVTNHEQRVKRIRLLLAEMKGSRPSTIDPILRKARELFPWYSEKVLLDYCRLVFDALKRKEGPGE